MSMRANALIRRFRHRQPDQSMAVVKALRSKNGNMRLRIVPKNTEESFVEPEGTLVTYSNDKNGHQTYTTRRGSVMTVQSDGRDSVVSTPPTTTNSTPSGSPPLLLPYGDGVDASEAVCGSEIVNLVKFKWVSQNSYSFQFSQNDLFSLIQQLLLNPTPMTPAIVSLLLQPANMKTEMLYEPQAPQMLFPPFLPTGIPVQPL